jgi:uncharacterized protein (DUF169 family)
MTIEKNLEARPASGEGQPLEALDRSQVDLNYLHDIVVNKLKVERRPVAITYCTDKPPAGYEPLGAPACALIKEGALGRKVYVDEQAQDCLVGQYHLGMHSGSELIKEGRYLTMAQGMFTEEGARRNKAATPNLPTGTYRALAAAPLNEVPEDVPVHSMVVICDPQRAMMIAGSAMTRGGEFPLGELGWSVCSSLFSLPFYTRRSLFTIGDGGGRIHNSLKPSELFVVIPANDLKYIIELVENFSLKPQEMRKELMPGYYASMKRHGPPEN